MSTLSLLGSGIYDEDEKNWKFSGVIYFDSADEGSNIHLEAFPDDDGPLMTSSTNTANLPSRMTLSGKLLPLCRSPEDQNEDIKLALTILGGFSRVEAAMTSPVLGSLSLYGSITESGNDWDLALYAQLDEKDAMTSSFKRQSSWKHGIGMGKRLRVNGFQECPPEPTFVKYEYLTNRQVRILWNVPVQIEGQVVCMRLIVKKAKNKRNQKNMKILGNKEKVEKVFTDRLGKKIEEGRVICITFAPIALRSDETYGNEGEYYAFYRSSTHSYVLDNLSAGEYECSMTVQTLQSTLDVQTDVLDASTTLVENHFPPFYIHAPPQSPSHLSVLLQKSRTISCADEPDVYEPFVIVSWKPPIASRKHMDKLKRYKDYEGGPADGFIISLQVYNIEFECWQTFGDATKTQISCLKSGLDKESCSVVALPEFHKDSKQQPYSKLRVSVKSYSKFGQSDPVYSNNLDIPKFNVDKETKEVDFVNLDDACCVICMESICFEERFKNIRNGFHQAFFGNQLRDFDQQMRLPLNGLLTMDENMFECPVTPTCCSHVFHLKCLLDWCKNSRERQTRELGSERAVPKCPLCMQEFKHVISQVLDPALQSERQLFCATAVIKKREMWNSSNIQSHFHF